jgi:hypothetical protein
MLRFYEHDDEPSNSINVRIFLIRHVVAFQEGPYAMPSVDICRDWAVSGIDFYVIAKYIGPNFFPSSSKADLKRLTFSVKMYGFQRNKL